MSRHTFSVLILVVFVLALFAFTWAAMPATAPSHAQRPAASQPRLMADGGGTEPTPTVDPVRPVGGGTGGG